MASKTKGLNKVAKTTTPKTSSTKPTPKAVTSATLKPRSKPLKRSTKQKTPPSSTTEATTESREPVSSSAAQQLVDQQVVKPSEPHSKLDASKEGLDSSADSAASSEGGKSDTLNEAVGIHEPEEDATSEEDDGDDHNGTLIPSNIVGIAEEEVDSENTPSDASGEPEAELLDSSEDEEKEIKGQRGQAASEKEEDALPKDSILAQSIELVGDSYKGNLKSLLDSNVKTIAFVVYTKASTPGCTKQCQAFSTVAKEAKKIGCRLLGLSPDGSAVQENFHSQQKLGIDLVVSNNKTLLEKLGCMKGGKPVRSVVAIDKTGNIVYEKHKVSPESSSAEFMEWLRSTHGGESQQPETVAIEDDSSDEPAVEDKSEPATSDVEEEEVVPASKEKLVRGLGAKKADKKVSSAAKKGPVKESSKRVIKEAKPKAASESTKSSKKPSEAAKGKAPPSKSKVKSTDKKESNAAAAAESKKRKVTASKKTESPPKRVRKNDAPTTTKSTKGNKKTKA